jgi:hypothetical protein
MTDTFASRLRAYLHAEKDRLGGQPLTAEHWDKAVNGYLSAYLATERMVGAKRKAPKTPYFEALCRACGINPVETDRKRMQQLDRIVSAMRDLGKIAGVEMPAEEINRRAARYRQKFPTWALTPESLLKRWGECGSATGLASRLDEPDGWRERIDDLYTAQEQEDCPGQMHSLRRDAWSQLPRHMKESVLRRWQKLVAAPVKRDPVAQSYFGD